MSGMQYITNWPEITRTGDNLLCFQSRTGDREICLCWEFERFVAWLDYANAKCAELRILHEGADVVPIRPPG